MSDSNKLAEFRQDQVKRGPVILDMLRSQKTRTAIAQVAGKILDPDRVLRLMVNSIDRIPMLAQCTPRSILGGVMMATSLGLECNTPAQQAFLIPYKTRALNQQTGKWGPIHKAEFQIGYKGFLTLGHRSGVVKRTSANAIYEGDDFTYEDGSIIRCSFKRRLDRDAGALQGAYCFTELEDGNQAITVMRLADIYRARARSQTFNTLTWAVDNAEENGTEKEKADTKRKLRETPWVMFEAEMAAKTAIRAHFSRLPIYSGPLAAAVALEVQQEAGTLDLEGLAEPDVAQSVIEGGEPPAQEAQETGPGEIEHEQQGPAVEINTTDRARAPADEVEVEIKHTQQAQEAREAPKAQEAQHGNDVVNEAHTKARAGRKAEANPPASDLPQIREEPPPAEDDGFGEAV